jgi:hypothetical protein
VSKATERHDGKADDTKQQARDVEVHRKITG